MIVRTDSRTINSTCPGCGVVFGWADQAGDVTCPLCHTVQHPPVVKLDQTTYYCQTDRIMFGALADATPQCSVCRATFNFHNPHEGGSS
jgi:hypothetical protein